MANTMFQPGEVDRSMEFFMHPDSYEPFEIDRAARLVVGCIDPRDQHGKLLTVVQTAGGGVGEGLDAAIAYTVTEGRPVGIRDALIIDRENRPAVKLCAHEECRLIQGLRDVQQEMAQPTAFTQESVDRWVDLYKIGDEVTPGILKSVQGVAEEMRHETYDEAELLSSVDELYPDSKNVAKMKGANQAGIYVVNHHPYVGLNRHRKHRERGLQVQGYHDSLGAGLANQLISHMNPDLRNTRLAAHLLRAAAVRTVIGGSNSNMRYLEAHMTTEGFKVEEVAA